ncbi:hypothetical protein MYO4S_00219 [Serratia phage 4S]|nr:hypothetical protein MYO4S_00219 [Serratia phage 4S]
MKIAHVIRNVTGFVTLSAATAVIVANVAGAVTQLETLVASAVIIALAGLTAVLDKVGK